MVENTVEAVFSAKGADFYEAVVTALEVARRGLVWEHERVLESREARLWSEITRLNRELSVLRAEDLSKRVLLDCTCSDSVDEGSNHCAIYKSDGFQTHECWFTDKSPCLKPSDITPKIEEAVELDNWQLPWTDAESDVEESEQERRPSRWSYDWEKDQETTVAPQPSSQAPEGANLPRQSTQSRGRMSLRARISQLSSPTESEDHPNFTWRRTADTVIMRAGSDFFGEAHHSLECARHIFCKKLRTDKVFQIRLVETVMGLVILLNCMTLGVSSEINQTWVGWIIVDSVFAGIFTVELFWKLYVLGARGYFVGSEWRWNDFEVTLVAMAWIEVATALADVGQDPVAQKTQTPKSSLFRMLRLMRLAKLLRILRLQVFCDLLMMLNGAIGSWKTLLYSMVLVCIPLYGVSLILKETLGIYHEEGDGAENFQKLDLAFFTLFRCIVAGECTQEDGKPIFVMVTKSYGFGFGLVYCLVQFFMTFGLFNVIVAIYVENTVSAAKFNDISVKRQRLRDREYFEDKAEELLKMIWRYYCQTKLRHETDSFDEDAANQLVLTQEFFDELIQQQTFVDLLRDLDISDDDQMDLFETLDVEGVGKIDLNDFVIGIGKLRGEARKADVIGVALMLRSLQHRLLQMEGRLSFMMKKPSRDKCGKRGSNGSKRGSGQAGSANSCASSADGLPAAMVPSFFAPPTPEPRT